MRLAVVAAGFTPGEADQLRRAMGAWRRPGVIDEFRRKLLDGMLASGFTQQYAESIFHQIRGFGDYGFPESHAASFALLVYVSSWLKCHHQAAFTAALLNSQPMGFYAPAQLIRNARDHGVEIRGVDVNHSRWDCTLEKKGVRTHLPERPEGCFAQTGPDPFFWEKAEDAQGTVPIFPSEKWDCTPSETGEDCPPFRPDSERQQELALRLGLRQVRGFSESHAQRIDEIRQDGPFCSMEDFSRRTGLSHTVATRLAHAGAFKSLQLDRRNALWNALGQDRKEMPLFDALPPAADTQTALPEMSPIEEMLADYRNLGLTLGQHPMGFLREGLTELNVAPSEDLSILPKDRPVAVAGIVLVRQRPGTAKGITFVTLEDETGVANLIIRPEVWQRFRRVALTATVLLVRGRLQREGRVIHVLTNHLEDLSPQLTTLATRSRNFC